MTRDILLVLSGYAVGVLLMCWFGQERAQAVCGDCAAKDGELRDLRLERHTLTRALANWMRRAQQAESSQVGKAFQQIFRPMGVPSTEREVERQREWREHRALRGMDHHYRHPVNASCDSEAATEILMGTIGGWEIDV